MAALSMTDDPKEWMDDEPPLVRAMRAFTRSVVQRIVVRAPVLLLFEEQEQQSADGSVHELVARTGMLLRGPFTLLGRPRRSRMGRGAQETSSTADGATAREKARKA